MVLTLPYLTPPSLPYFLLLTLTFLPSSPSRTFPSLDSRVLPQVHVQAQPGPATSVHPPLDSSRDIPCLPLVIKIQDRCPFQSAIITSLRCDSPFKLAACLLGKEQPYSDYRLRSSPSSAVGGQEIHALEFRLENFVLGNQSVVNRSQLIPHFFDVLV